MMGPEQAMYCIGCDYDLRGLTEHRCPECGRPFLPDDPTTFRKLPSTVPDPDHDRQFLTGAAIAWALLIPSYLMPDSMALFALLPFGLGTLLAVRVVVRSFREMVQRRAHGWRFAVGFVAAILAVLVALLGGYVSLFVTLRYGNPLMPLFP